ncbi:hypothetical protein [Pseudomonas chlororaphis]|uniref:hypothetical protein n=1 Tax=Pseudomonas chlororaphis TaxID=587753 RepID=UPI0039E1C150
MSTSNKVLRSATPEQNTRLAVSSRQVMRAASLGQELGTNVDFLQAVTARNT